MLKTLKDIDTYMDFNKYNFLFQEELTPKLDSYDNDFDQEIINEIVLWKVDRYALVEENTLNLLNKISKHDNIIDEELTEKLINSLINIKWIKLPMASTILRFKNPNIYQIIDQRVYRIIYWKELKLSTLKNKDAYKLYIKYLKDLKNICNDKNIDFSLSDRILYLLDKDINKWIKIIY